MGTYFFLADEIVLQQRTVQTVVRVLSELGGVIELCIASFLMIATWYNDFNFVIKSIRAIYFESVDKDKSLIPIKIKGPTIMRMKLCCRRNIKTKLYYKGQKKIHQDLDMFRMIQILKKLQATMTVLFDI